MTPHHLDELAAVVRAPNPSPMTLEGTNTYLVGEPGRGELVVVDPGPDLAAHRGALDAAVAALDAAVVAVVVTHHHADHAGALWWAGDWGVPVWAFAPALVSADAASPTDVRPLRDGDVLDRAGTRLQALHTPGHSSDHVCLRVQATDVVLTGDHVLGRGTTMIGWPDGNLADYLASLRRLAAVGAAALYPGHGQVVSDPGVAVSGLLAHRRQRERQVLEALAAGDATAGQIVARVYADVGAELHPAARRSVRAHVAKLVDEGRVAADGETFRLRPPGG